MSSVLDLLPRLYIDQQVCYFQDGDGLQTCCIPGTPSSMLPSENSSCSPSNSIATSDLSPTYVVTEGSQKQAVEDRDGGHVADSSRNYRAFSIGDKDLTLQVQPVSAKHTWWVFCPLHKAFSPSGRVCQVCKKLSKSTQTTSNFQYNLKFVNDTMRAVLCRTTAISDTMFQYALVMQWAQYVATSAQQYDQSWNGCQTSFKHKQACKCSYQSKQ